MKKEKGTIYFSILVTSFLIITSLSLVSAITAQNVWDPVKEMFTSWEAGDLSINVAKYIFLILITLVIFSILSVVPVLKDRNAGLRTFIAILVGFLATAYLSASEIHAILLSYGALGFALGAILPALILLFFSIEIDKQGGSGGKILSKVLWIGFIVWLIWKLAGAWYRDEPLEAWEAIGYIVVIVVSAIWIFFAERLILKALFKEELKSAAESIDKSARRTALAEIASNRRRAVDLRAAGATAEADELERAADRLEKALNK